MVREMNENAKDRCVPKYRLLNDVQIEQIHRATLEILETVGVKFVHAGGVKILQDAGCSVDADNIVRIPGSLVEECIESAPSRIDIYNRKGDLAMRLEGRNTYYGLGTDLITTCDLETGEIRDSVLQDVINAAKVADYCEDIDFIASFALPHDVPTNSMYLECARVEMENSIKPIFFTAAGKEDLEVIIEMAEIVAGGEDQLRNKPFIIQYSEPTAPLTHSEGAISKLLLCAEKKIPICYIPTVLLGATGPVTLAGGITQANAEALSGIVLHQLMTKGAPIISGWAVVPLDMRTTIYCYGAPDYRLTNSAFADMYHHYQIPMWSIVGTDSHCLDQQAAMEHAFSTLMATLDGANLVHDVGYLGQGLLGNPAAIVMCDEMISYIKRIIRGFEIDPETLALEIIRKVGPGGEYLTEPHTLKHFRQVLWIPKLMNREPPESWKKKGFLTYGEKLTERTREILKTYTPEPLKPEIRDKLEEIVRNAEKDLASVQFHA
jgi:trimethylamine--corrinoid protein Co-methyltransferase